jgi:DnaJ-domain-containing protein 1
MGADRRIGPQEFAALEGLGERELPALGQLDRLGLGTLSEYAYEEARRADEKAVDVAAACAELRAAAPRAASTILAALAELAASDGALAPREREVLLAVGRGLGLTPRDVRVILTTATAEASAPAADVTIGRPRPRVVASRGDVEAAHRVLGIEPGAGAEQIDAAYRRLVDRYNPAKVVELGCDFAVLAIRKLAGITDAYDTAMSAAESGH